MRSGTALLLIDVLSAGASFQGFGEVCTWQAVFWCYMISEYDANSGLRKCASTTVLVCDVLLSADVNKIVAVIGTVRNFRESRFSFVDVKHRSSWFDMQHRPVSRRCGNQGSSSKARHILLRDIWWPCNYSRLRQSYRRDRDTVETNERNWVKTLTWSNCDGCMALDSITLFSWVHGRGGGGVCLSLGEYQGKGFLLPC